jgi:hypothetical protein
MVTRNDTHTLVTFLVARSDRTLKLVTDGLLLPLLSSMHVLI